MLSTELPHAPIHMRQLAEMLLLQHGETMMRNQRRGDSTSSWVLQSAREKPGLILICPAPLK